MEWVYDSGPIIMLMYDDDNNNDNNNTKHFGSVASTFID
jgi:hypothetical protein